jgi:hypothetical protein
MYKAYNVEVRHEHYLYGRWVHDASFATVQEARDHIGRSTLPDHWEHRIKAIPTLYGNPSKVVR